MGEESKGTLPFDQGDLVLLAEVAGRTTIPIRCSRLNFSGESAIGCQVIWVGRCGRALGARGGRRLFDNRISRNSSAEDVLTKRTQIPNP